MTRALSSRLASTSSLAVRRAASLDASLDIGDEAQQRKGGLVRSIIAFVGVAGASLGMMGVSVAQTDPNPPQNNPDRQSWELFVTVNANVASAGNNNALFESWASDGDTFRTLPAWPSGAAEMQIGQRALSVAFQRAHPRFTPQVLPAGAALVGEETRRNKPDFDFIVQNNLFKISRLRAAFRAGKPIAFPVDSIEVKANWVEVGRLKEFNGFSGSAAEAGAAYHINSTGGRQYALVSFHIISKREANWTWATFEHKDNPGRCDVLGCKDNFGALDTYVAPLSMVESPTHYPDCVKSPALRALLAEAHLDPAFSNYCLKGSQSDFADPSGVAIRLGNSVTEQSFVAQSSCMTCHGRAAFGADGHATTSGGFDPTAIDDPPGSGNAPVGPINSSWREGDLMRFGLPADFVWSVPFCAIDDTAQPPETRSRLCATK